MKSAGCDIYYGKYSDNGLLKINDNKNLCNVHSLVCYNVAK